VSIKNAIREREREREREEILGQPKKKLQRMNDDDNLEKVGQKCYI